MKRFLLIRSSAGMTLIELLIAITILGVIFTILYSGFQLVATGQARGLSKIEQTSSMRTLFNFLRRTIEQSQAAPVPSNRRFSLDASFVGDPQQLRLVAPVAHLDRGYQIISIYSKRNSKGKQLVMGYEPFSGQDISKVEPEDEVILLDKLGSITFAYLDTNDEQPVWRDDWHDRKTLPALVRVQIARSQLHSNAWPTMFVAPRINQTVQSKRPSHQPPANYGRSARSAMHGL